MRYVISTALTPNQLDFKLFESGKVQTGHATEFEL